MEKMLDPNIHNTKFYGGTKKYGKFDFKQQIQGVPRNMTVGE